MRGKFTTPGLALAITGRSHRLLAVSVWAPLAVLNRLACLESRAFSVDRAAEHGDSLVVACFGAEKAVDHPQPFAAMFAVEAHETGLTVIEEG